MSPLVFTVDVAGLSAWDRENLTLSIMKQGSVVGMTADAEVRGTEVTVELHGEPLVCVAYEAAIRSWVSANNGGSGASDREPGEAAQGAGG